MSTTTRRGGNTQGSPAPCKDAEAAPVKGTDNTMKMLCVPATAGLVVAILTTFTGDFSYVTYSSMSNELLLVVALATGCFLRAMSRLFRWTCDASLERLVSCPENVLQRFKARSWKLVELMCLVAVETYLVGGQDWAPWFAGGAGAIDPLVPPQDRHRVVPFGLALLHALRMGYLLEWWMFEDGFRFPYLTLHHIITTGIIFMAHREGYCQLGAFVIYIHDVAGCSIQALAWMNQIGWLPGLLTTFAIATPTWGYLMLYVFPSTCFMATATEDRFFNRREWQAGYMLFGLLMVHHVEVMLRLFAYVPKFARGPRAAAIASKKAECD